jgi:hypothetical protein
MSTQSWSNYTDISAAVTNSISLKNLLIHRLDTLGPKASLLDCLLAGNTASAVLLVAKSLGTSLISRCATEDVYFSLLQGETVSELLFSRGLVAVSKVYKITMEPFSRRPPGLTGHGPYSHHFNHWHHRLHRIVRSHQIISHV